MATRAEWSERVRKWERSGLTIEEFARREGIKAKQLGWWRWKLSSIKAAAQPPGLEPRFLPVRVVAPSLHPAAVPIEIALSNGHLVRVPPGFDPAMLGSILSIAAEVPSC
jgi:transposase